MVPAAAKIALLGHCVMRPGDALNGGDSTVKGKHDAFDQAGAVSQDPAHHLHVISLSGHIGKIQIKRSQFRTLGLDANHPADSKGAPVSGRKAMGLVDIQSQDQRLKVQRDNSPGCHKGYGGFLGPFVSRGSRVIVPRASITFEAAAIARSGNRH